MSSYFVTYFASYFAIHMNNMVQEWTFVRETIALKEGSFVQETIAKHDILL
jgi:hypothetical protein